MKIALVQQHATLDPDHNRQRGLDAVAEAARELGHRSHLYGPGELLTLRYWFRPDRDTHTNDLLAARSLRRDLET